MRTLLCIAVSVLLLAVPVVDAAGFGGGPGQDEGPDLWKDLEFKPVVGNWAEYSMVPKGEKPMTMRFAIVGEEDDAHWFETVMTNEDGMVMISKMLVAGDPEDQDNIKRMIVKAGGEPAMEIPVQVMAMMERMAPAEMEPTETEAPDAEELEEKMADLGVESITVPGGTFKATHWQYKSEEDVFDAWISSGVGPYGVVKSASAEFEMVLVASGDDAKTLITETPQSPPMQGMRMPGGGGK